MGSIHSSRLIIRADSTVAIGAGHVMRCLALAQAAIASGNSVWFLTTLESPALLQRLEQEGLIVLPLRARFGTLEDADELIASAQQQRVDWVILDGYHFATAYQQRLHNAKIRFVYFDDVGDKDFYWAPVILNQNIYAAATLYPNRLPEARLLLGVDYISLRREFLAWHSWQREIRLQTKNLLITLGGSDADNVTLRLLQIFQVHKFADLAIKIVIGVTNPHRSALEAEIAQHGSTQIELLTNVIDMPTLMAWADLAITAGGSSCYETAFMGLPSLQIALAENQVGVAAKLHELGVSRFLGWHQQVTNQEIQQALKYLCASGEVRQAMSERGQRLVDGKGAQRVLAALAEIKRAYAPSLLLRPAQADDCESIWQWANDPLTRAASFSSQPIAWENHCRWFERKLQDPHFRMMIGVDAMGTRVGVVRFELNPNSSSAAIISINLAPTQRGKGWGNLMLVEACQQLFATTSVQVVWAYIKPENVASLNTFGKAGFADPVQTTVEGHPAICLTRRN